MFKWLIHWHNGEAKILEFGQEDFPGVGMFPSIYIEYHWTAKIARSHAVSDYTSISERDVPTNVNLRHMY